MEKKEDQWSVAAFVAVATGCSRIWWEASMNTLLYFLVDMDTTRDVTFTRALAVLV